MSKDIVRGLRALRKKHTFMLSLREDKATSDEWTDALDRAAAEIEALQAKLQAKLDKALELARIIKNPSNIRVTYAMRQLAERAIKEIDG